MNVYQDDGSGHSSESRAWWERNFQAGIMTKPRRVSIDDHRDYSMEIVGENHEGKKSIVLLSGTGAGYKGTAPCLSEDILLKLGVPPRSAEKALAHRHLFYRFYSDGSFHEVEVRK